MVVVVKHFLVVRKGEGGGVWAPRYLQSLKKTWRNMRGQMCKEEEGKKIIQIRSLSLCYLLVGWYSGSCYSSSSSNRMSGISCRVPSCRDEAMKLSIRRRLAFWPETKLAAGFAANVPWHCASCHGRLQRRPSKQRRPKRPMQSL